MGVDWRADHSFRVPRADLSLSLGTPNACSVEACHGDKPIRWAADWTAKWYGQARSRHYGSTLTAARTGNREVLGDLVRLTQDRLYPAVVQATAVSLLERYTGTEAQQAAVRALADEESLVRRSAADGAWTLLPEDRVRHVAPLLGDPVEGVRSQAARLLAETAGTRLNAKDRAALDAALGVFERAMRYQADFASAGYNLGNLYAALGRTADAEKQYRRALAIELNRNNTELTKPFYLTAAYANKLRRAKETLRSAERKMH